MPAPFFNVLAAPSVLLEIADDYRTAIIALTTLCAESAKARGISETELQRRFTGETLETAVEAFLQALLDFFPPRHAAPYQQMLAIRREAQLDLVATTLKELEKFKTKTEPISVETPDQPRAPISITEMMD